MQAEDEAEDEDDDDDEKHEDASESTATRLDPALFAAAFARHDAAARQALQPREAPKKKRMARGRDGQPMMRVHGEQTLVRALAPEHDIDVVDTPLEHTPLDPGRALPTARERAYRKRKLGLRASDVGATAIDGGKKRAEKPAKDASDPLGMNDPAFLPGGEFAHLARRTRSKRPRAFAASTGTRGAGGRVQAPHAARMGPAQNFARSRG